MKDFQEFFLMSTEDVKRYAVEVLHKFEPDEETECIEIGDGNINYVFKIWSKRDGHSVIVKQADKLLRSSGRPLDIYRNKIEANILQLEGQLAPGYVPEVYYYDETMAATSMEDVSAFKSLRKELAASLNRFLGELTVQERYVFVRRYWYLDSLADIAKNTGFSGSKVASMLYRLRGRLKKQLIKEELL